jgi:hypothetical protein
MKIVDTLGEQAVLEALLDRSKPPVPPECRHLHYLLATPFRYGAPYPAGSRFRRAGHTPGVFYASKTQRTAIAEAAFHRILFYADSPATPWPVNAGEYTLFSARFRTAHGLDLGKGALADARASWMHPTEYEATQALADSARTAGIEVIRYLSVRDAGGSNFAILACRAFASHEPLERHTWRVHLGANGARAVSDTAGPPIAFDRSAFASDPRLASIVWDR